MNNLHIGLIKAHFLFWLQSYLVAEMHHDSSCLATTPSSSWVKLSCPSTGRFFCSRTRTLGPNWKKSKRSKACESGTWTSNCWVSGNLLSFVLRRKKRKKRPHSSRHVAQTNALRCWKCHIRFVIEYWHDIQLWARGGGPSPPPIPLP